jgi:predicted nuclease of predicted toxin-antitoxin system
LRFKLDENMPADLASLLHAEGHEVDDVVAEGLAGEDDPVVLAAAVQERRILIAYDLDFADIRRYSPGSHAGIVVFRLQDQRWKTLEGPARRALTDSNLKTLEKGLAIVDEARIRYRRPRRKTGS